jgi:hypothetical protein
MFPAVSLLSQLIVPGPARSLAVSIFAAPKLAKELPARVLLWTYFRYHREVGMNREQRDWLRYTKSTPEVFIAEKSTDFSATVKGKDVRCSSFSG